MPNTPQEGLKTLSQLAQKQRGYISHDIIILIGADALIEIIDRTTINYLIQICILYILKMLILKKGIEGYENGRLLCDQKGTCIFIYQSKR